MGVYASQTASYNITGTITYKVENSITANTSVTSLSASRTCSHQDATGNVSASNGVELSKYFTVILNGSTLTNDEIKSNISNGTLSVTPATGLTYDSSTCKVYMTPSSVTTTNGINESNNYTLTLTYDSNTKASVSIPTTATVGSWSSNVSTSTSDNYAATCTTTGWQNLKRCSVCNTKTATGSSIAELGHDYQHTGYYPSSTYLYGSWSSWTTTTAATCTTSGTKKRTRDKYDYKIYTCSRCSDSYQDTSKHYYTDDSETETISALGHSWNSGTVTKSATCTIDGVKTYTCQRSGCGETKTESISALGHNYNQSGYTSGYEYGSWSSWSTTTAATCTTTGTKTRSRTRWDYPIYTCSRCSDSYTGTTRHYYSDDKETDTISALGHNYVSNNDAKEATCTSAGRYESKTCSRCSDTTGGGTISALGHNFSSTYTTDTEATCTTAGSKSQHCSRCSATQNSTTISALGHNYGSAYGYSYSSNGDSTHDYTYKKACSRCSTVASYNGRTDCSLNRSKKIGSGSASGHNYWYYYSCSSCGYSYNSPTYSESHTLSATGKCTACGYSGIIISSSVFGTLSTQSNACSCGSCSHGCTCLSSNCECVLCDKYVYDKNVLTNKLWVVCSENSFASSKYKNFEKCLM